MAGEDNRRKTEKGRIGRRKIKKGGERVGGKERRGGKEEVEEKEANTSERQGEKEG